MLLLQTTGGKRLAYRIVSLAMTLRDFQGHARAADRLKRYFCSTVKRLAIRFQLTFAPRIEINGAQSAHD